MAAPGVTSPFASLTTKSHHARVLEAMRDLLALNAEITGWMHASSSIEIAILSDEEPPYRRPVVGVSPLRAEFEERSSGKDLVSLTSLVWMVFDDFRNRTSVVEEKGISDASWLIRKIFRQTSSARALQVARYSSKSLVEGRVDIGIFEYAEFRDSRLRGSQRAETFGDRSQSATMRLVFEITHQYLHDRATWDHVNAASF